MEEKEPILASPDFGKDEDTVQAYLKKLDTLERDIDNFSNNIGELAALSRTLIDKTNTTIQKISKSSKRVWKINTASYKILPVRGDPS